MNKRFFIVLIVVFTTWLCSQTPPVQSQDRLFTIQVASSLIENSALSLEKKLVKKGYPAYVESSSLSGKTVYRVRVGKFKSKNEALSLAQVLSQKEKMSYWITWVGPTQSRPQEEIKKEVSARLPFAEKPDVSARTLPEEKGKTGKGQKREEGKAAIQEEEAKPEDVRQLPAQKEPLAAESKEISGTLPPDGKTDISAKTLPEEKWETEKADEKEERSVGAQEDVKRPEDDRQVTVQQEAPAPEPKKADDPISGHEEPRSHQAAWPEQITKVYAYRAEDGNLSITNVFEQIPRGLRQRLERVSVFPVRFLFFDQGEKVLHLDVEEEEQVRLAGVDITSPSVIPGVISYLEKNLRDVPLRFEYNPKYQSSKQGPVLFGTLSFQEGKSVNWEIIRRGIAPFDPTGLPFSQGETLQEAEEMAKKEKAGIWGKPVISEDKPSLPPAEEAGTENTD